jgi:short-subunit dehydrogenase
VLITGATSGIGHALALVYAAPGRRLCLLGRNASRMETVATACRAAGASVSTALIDVQDRTAMAGAIAEMDGQGPIDLVIACAGITSGLGDGRTLEDPEAVRGLLGINLIGVINTLDPVIAAMVGRKRGHVGVVGSLAALRGLPYSPAYSAAKAAVHAYAEGLRPVLRGLGVDVSVIAPGFVATPLNAAITAPRPLQVSADKAARIIRRGLDARKAMIAFPLPLYLGLRLLGLLPARLGDAILSGPRVDVPETTERWRG